MLNTSADKITVSLPGYIKWAAAMNAPVPKVGFLMGYNKKIVMINTNKLRFEPIILLSSHLGLNFVMCYLFVRKANSLDPPLQQGRGKLADWRWPSQHHSRARYTTEDSEFAREHETSLRKKRRSGTR